LQDLEDARVARYFFSGPDDTPSPYHLSKTAPHPNLLVKRINNDYCATRFIPALTSYLRTSGISNVIPTDQDRFDVYNQITVHLALNDAVNVNKNINRIWATPAVPDSPGKKGHIAHFDTALVCVDYDQDNAAVTGSGLLGAFHNLCLPPASNSSFICRTLYCSG
jgi:hypothetical protein